MHPVYSRVRTLSPPHFYCSSPFLLLLCSTCSCTSSTRPASSGPLPSMRTHLAPSPTFVVPSSADSRPLLLQGYALRHEQARVSLPLSCALQGCALLHEQTRVSLTGGVHTIPSLLQNLPLHDAHTQGCLPSKIHGMKKKCRCVDLQRGKKTDEKLLLLLPMQRSCLPLAILCPSSL